MKDRDERIMMTGLLLGLASFLPLGIILGWLLTLLVESIYG